MKTGNNMKKDSAKAPQNMVNNTVNSAKTGKDKKPAAKQGDSCPINPAEGISYLPPKDENKL